MHGETLKLVNTVVLSWNVGTNLAYYNEWKIKYESEIFWFVADIT